MAAADNIVYVNTSAARTITLPTPTNGRVLTVKDSTGSAGTNNITINPSAAETIDGGSSYIINRNNGVVRLSSDGTNWFVTGDEILNGSGILTTTKQVGLGGASTTAGIVQVGATNPLTGTNQNGIFVPLTGTSAATATIVGVRTDMATAAAAFTATLVAGVRIPAINKGAGSSITTAIGVVADDQSGVGATNSAGFSDTLTPSGSSFIYQAGTIQSILSGMLKMGGGASFTNVRTVTTTATVGANDTVILCNQSAAFALTLPTATDGRYLIIKDFSNTAATNNITVTRASSDLIDGATTFVINVNRSSVTLVGSSGNWSLV